MPIEKLIFIHWGILYGNVKLSKSELFKGGNNERGSTGERAWVLPEHSLGPALGGSGAPSASPSLPPPQPDSWLALLCGTARPASLSCGHP